jgi:prevent-host-death family protein
VAITTISSREFNQDTGRAKRAARKGPVFITDRGRPAHVLLSIKQYEDLAGKRKSIVEMLAMPEVAEIDFEPPRIGGDEFPVPPDLS